MNREMNLFLAETLAKLTDDQRLALMERVGDYHVEALAEGERGQLWVKQIHSALALQLIAEEHRQESPLTAFEADHHAEVEQIDRRVHGDPAPVVGHPATHDPETGKWTFGEGN